MEDQGTWEGYDSFPFDQLFREFDLIFEHKNMLKYLPESFLKVCILRDPLERVYSQHADWARLTDQNIAHNPPKIREEKLKARRLSLAEMVSQASHNSTVRHFQNGMCKSFL